MLGIRVADWEHHFTVQQVMFSCFFLQVTFSNVTFLRGDVGSTNPCYCFHLSEHLNFVTVYVG